MKNNKYYIKQGNSFSTKLMCEKCFRLVDSAIKIKFYDDQVNDSEICYNDNIFSLAMKCPTCNKVTYFSSIDSNIAEIVRYFNLLKYTTLNSCQGHVYFINPKIIDDVRNGIEIIGDDISNYIGISTPYIMIEGNKKFTKKLYKILEKNGFSNISINSREIVDGVIQHSFYHEEDINKLITQSDFTIYFNGFKTVYNSLHWNSIIKTFLENNPYNNEIILTHIAKRIESYFYISEMDLMYDLKEWVDNKKK